MPSIHQVKSVIGRTTSDPTYLLILLDRDIDWENRLRASGRRIKGSLAAPVHTAFGSFTPAA